MKAVRHHSVVLANIPVHGLRPDEHRAKKIAQTAAAPSMPGPSRVQLRAGILVQASATFKILFGMAIIFLTFAAVVMQRIWVLEMHDASMQVQLNEYKATMDRILKQVPTVPEFVNEVPTSEMESEGSDLEDGHLRVRAKRNVPHQGIDLSTSGSEQNFTSKPRPVRKIKDNRRDRGTGNSQALQTTKNHKLKLLRLKVKLANSRRRAIQAKAKFYPAFKNFSAAKAVYLIPVAPNVDIKTSEQLIGPWYIGEGVDFGFNDFWYRDIALDVNRTSIIFKESGLHLIYAQVYYHLSLAIGEIAAPMGYRIYVKKNPANRSQFRRPISIAECVPSYPSTFFQTCFTQVVWYLEPGDAVYLEHFANSFPMIEADRQGKTFLGIVKLASAH